MKSTTKILRYPNKILTTPTVNWDFIANNKTELLAMIAKMEELLKARSEGVALAANQAGFDKRLFIVTDKLAQEHNISNVFINPVLNIVDTKMTEEKEGCLSFPELFFPVKRYDTISCDYYDLDGNKKIIILEGFIARVFQHECEHLDGKLYIDNLPRRERFQVLGKFKNRSF